MSAEEYLEMQAEFVLMHEDMFGHRLFGYGNTVTVEEDDHWARLSVAIASPRYVRHAALMLQFIGTGLQGGLDQPTKLSNGRQSLQFYTRISSTNGHYGHAVSGMVMHEVLDYLRHRATMPKTDRVPNLVKSAMRSVWQRATSSTIDAQFIDDTDAWIENDGRFCLVCFGNACDLSMYPDEYEPSNQYAHFDSHNLDTAHQQLTLLAGLAMIVRETQAWHDAGTKAAG